MGHTTHHCLTREEMEGLLDAVKSDPFQGKRDKALVCRRGLLASEVGLLLRDDLDFNWLRKTGLISEAHRLIGRRSMSLCGSIERWQRHRDASTACGIRRERTSLKRQGSSLLYRASLGIGKLKVRRSVRKSQIDIGA